MSSPATQQQQPRQQQIFLVGATGYTGRLVARELRDRGLAFVPAGRSAERLAALVADLGLDAEPLVVDTLSPEPLVERLADQAIVVNCAGPFSLYSDPLVDAVARRPVTYLDVTGEQAVVERSLERRVELARRHGATIVHSCAFESLLADLLGHVLVEMRVEMGERLRDVSSYYWFERLLASPGTRLTMRLVDHVRTVALEDGALRERGPAVEAVAAPDLPFVGHRGRALFVPYPEVHFFARAFSPRSAGSYLLLSENEARLMTRPASRPETTVDEVVARHRAAPQRGPTDEQRRRQRCGVAVVATDEQDRRRWAAFEGRDPYGLTAFIVAWACAKLLAAPLRPTGVPSPGEIFAPSVFFDDLRDRDDLFDQLRHG
jgi:short subunit dehydrogenase-like uncharacterized protein